jgi:hypothetical protein
MRLMPSVGSWSQSFPLLFLISGYERYTFGAQGRGRVRLEKGKKEGARVEMKMFE